MNKLLVTCLLLAQSSLVLAHPGHGLEGAAAGFMHPLTGWDHLLVMLAVGLWAGRIGGSARWQLPLTFLLVMAAGAGVGMAGYGFSGIESAIAASVMAMGLLLVLGLQLPRALQLGVTALFALCHGLAHGAELPTDAGLAALAGMLLATGLLHIAGLVLALPRLQRIFASTLGLVMLGAGGYMLVG